MTSSSDVDREPAIERSLRNEQKSLRAGASAWEPALLIVLKAVARPWSGGTPADPPEEGWDGYWRRARPLPGGGGERRGSRGFPAFGDLARRFQRSRTGCRGGC